MQSTSTRATVKAFGEAAEANIPLHELPFSNRDATAASKISTYQVMTAVSMVYLAVLVMLLPAAQQTPLDLGTAIRQLVSAPMILLVQLLWLAMFFYYGRSRVTGSKLTFHVIGERI